MKNNKNLKFDLFKDSIKNKEVLHEIHLKLIPTKLTHSIWKVNYSYKTIKANKKEHYKFVIANDGTDAKFNFIEYINEFNKNNQYRSLSNVKILDVSYVGNLEQSY